jgi:hypothetical protein
VAASIYYRKLVTEEPLDYAVADRAAATALIAVRAGACRRGLGGASGMTLQPRR